MTGAFGGLGRHFALTLVRAGCRVALAGHRTNEGEQLLTQIRADGGDGCVVKLDVRDATSVSSAFDATADALGTVQIVVNCAGIAVTRPAIDLY